jgi:hypothetical protein
MANRWELKEQPLDKDGNPPPFSSFNLPMMMLSTLFACEELGLTNGTPLMDAYHRTITHPDDMIKGGK